jgi:hypothetical protein
VTGVFKKCEYYNTFVWQERFGMSGMIARRRAGLPSVPLGRDAETVTRPSPSVATETVEELPDDFLTAAIDLTESRLTK